VSRVQACKSQLVLSVATLLVHWWKILGTFAVAATKKCAKQLHLRVCGDSWTFTCLSTTVH